MRDGQATRRRIHAEALRLFVDKGVTETSVRDLTQAAGVAEGTLYRHYASKDDLVAELFASNYAALARRLDAVRESPGDFRTRLEAIVAEVCRFYDDEPTLFRFLLLVQHQALPRLTTGGADPVQVLRGMIEQAIDRREITLGDAALGTAMVLGLMLQPATALVYGRLDPPFSRFAGDIAAACWRALNPTPDDDRRGHHA
ncbi:MAG: TetR/AcrR family transcriptional regulator [Alphaproteobacteria bacterium]